MVFVGHALSQATPRFARASTFLIPGGARHAGPLAGAVGASFLAGALALLSPADEIFAQLSYLAFGRYLGFEQHWPPTEFFISETWAWVALLVAAVIHIVTVLLDRRGADESDQ